jgi:uncharacterized protein
MRAAFRTALAAALLAFLPFAVAWAATAFPELTGRVVDQAAVIDAASKSAIESKLVDLENKSGIQLVVATVTSLDGQEIEPYANDLFRVWKLGEAKKNNGVLLLVAPNEHRVRIEVGPGLEGTLTDAVSSVIIRNAITPRFKAGDFSGGITRGVDDIITALTTDSADWQGKSEPDDSTANIIIGLIIMAVPVLFISLIIFLFIRAALRHQIVWGGGGSSSVGSSNVSRSSSSWSSGSSWGGGGSSSGGFSGGGGTSSGGGASGSW